MASALTRFGQHCRELRSRREMTLGDQAGPGLDGAVPHGPGVVVLRVGRRDDGAGKVTRECFGEWIGVQGLHGSSPLLSNDPQMLRRRRHAPL